MKSELNNLLQKEMDRTAFLQHVGIGLVAITGIASVVKALTSMSGSGQKVTVNGFGSGSYGGNGARKLTD